LIEAEPRRYHFVLTRLLGAKRCAVKSAPKHEGIVPLDFERVNRLELPWLGGNVAELGRKLGVAMPVHNMIMRR
jgi:ketopantoate reductase